MLESFRSAIINHTAGPRLSGTAAIDVITRSDFDTARQEIVAWRGYEPTPLVELSNLAAKLSVGNIYYKHEGSRFGLGSFKALGGSYAVYKVLQQEISSAIGRDVPLTEITKPSYAFIASTTTVISATDGNHGRSVAWAAQRLAMPCRIYIHAQVSEERAEAIRAFGATVIRIEGDYDASLQITRAAAKDNNWLIVSDTSWLGYTQTPGQVMAGYGVMAYEIIQSLEQSPSHVFLQGGVGGLAASVAARFRQHWGENSPRIIVVEPDLAQCLMVSAKAIKATAVPIFEETMMAGLSCGEPSMLAWDVLAEEVEDFMAIPENVVGPAVRLMARPIGDDPALEVGESAIAGLAALVGAAMQSELRVKLGLDEKSRIVLIGTEGVTDRAFYNKLVAAGD